MRNWFKRRKLLNVEVLPDHESGLRRMMADASSEPYVAFRTLVEAQAHPEGVVILEGDYGGQIYVVARAASVGCSEEALARLLAELDGLLSQHHGASYSRLYSGRSGSGNLVC